MTGGEAGEPTLIAGHSLRHLRVFLAVVDTHSVTRAAESCHVTQPAVTQAIAKLERTAGAPLFGRTPQGLFATPLGDILALRVRRAFEHLDPVLSALSPRLLITATTAQLQALIAVREAENFTLAARRLGLAQPTVHRAVSQLEHEAARPLLERTSYGMVATRTAQALAQAARLAFVELDQAEADLADAQSGEAGRIVIGGMPLSRSYLLPKAIARFREMRPNLPVHVVEGPYDDLLAGLRRGEIDFLVGALRDPLPIADVEQRHLFSDTLALVTRRHHPLADRNRVEVADVAAYPCVVAQPGTPIRAHFDALFRGIAPPASIVESGSMILMRELLEISDHVGCISRLQVEAEISRGLLTPLAVDLSHTSRRIGLTLRASWMPTNAQREFVGLLESAAGNR
ncbi:LysR family transcriptional regulator [Aureimonas sp. ME7]|uniref:LysR family transcriptional regulator n=1 Tax=Aureimonas sp. ME7 TaxID=2744252 RepID=UPI0015F64423|nr:LysR family transcriptional regulator [Aureimonas sp. ME7]